MELPDYVQSVAFRLVHPDAPGTKALRLAAGILRRANVPLDVLNTRLPCESGQMRRRLREARRICPAGVFAVGAIINRTVARLPEGEAFLSLGLGDGFPLLAAISGNPHKPCIGVDQWTGGILASDERPRAAFLKKFESLRGPGHHLHQLDFRDFFAQLENMPIGFCLIGSNEDPLERLDAVEPYLAENAIVLIENANSAEVRNAGLAFIRSSRNQYRVLLDCRVPHHGELTFGNGLLLFQLLGRNAAADRRARKPIVPALVPAA
jgi:hypothetical protein